MKNLSKPILWFLVLAFFSASCGESSQLASGGIGGTGISQGTITEFGSIILNGVRFNTDSANFTIDDNQAGTSQNDLSIGMQVRIQVDASGNTATLVEFEPEVQGPIEGPIDTANNSITVLKRTVVVDEATQYEDEVNPGNTLTLSGLQPNDTVEVSGLTLIDGKIQATYIKKTGTFSPTDTFELRGIVSGYAGGNTFAIGTQTIDISGLSSTPAFTIANGQFLEVKGTQLTLGATLDASIIQFEDATLGANEADKLEIEGQVSDFSSPSSFSIANQPVLTSSATTLEGGASDDIINNVRLEVEGTLTGGVLVASNIKFHGRRIKVEANVESIDPVNQTVTLLGGVKVRINGLTQKSFAFASILVGDRLEIRAYLTTDSITGISTVTATSVEVGDNTDPVLLQAPLDIAPALGPDLSLLGVVAKTDLSPTFFKDLEELLVDSNLFFSQVTIGSLIKVKGTFVGGEIDAKTVEIEN